MATPESGESPMIAAALPPELARHWIKRLARATGVQPETARCWIYREVPAARRRQVARAIIEECDRIDAIVAETRRLWGSVDEEAGAMAGEAVVERSAPARGVGSKLSRLHRPPNPANVRGLSTAHHAVLNGRTIFPTRVRSALDAPAVIVPGAWQRKLGPVVTKGTFAGFPIFSLTLEERATCPRTCHHWRTCFGNGMPAAWRYRKGHQLEAAIARDLVALQTKHPRGFLVRLHVLGDFYSVGYVERWQQWLDLFPALHVFGYTAWSPETSIGAAIFSIASQRWERFAIRLSSPTPAPGRAVTLWQWSDSARREAAQRQIIVCPVETGLTCDCGSCGLCWSAASRSKAIGFIAHGPGRRGPSAGAAAGDLFV